MSEADFTDIDPSEPLSSLYRKINARTKANRSFESSPTPPSSPVANQFYVDSINGIFAQRNDDNTEWIFQWLIGQGAHSFVRLPEPATPSTVQVRTELDTLLNAGGFTDLEQQGADTFMFVSSASCPLVIEIPVPSVFPRWDGRLHAVYLDNVIDAGDTVEIQLEGTGTTGARLTRPGDFWIGRVDAAGAWETLATNAMNGVQAVSASAVNVDDFTGLYIVETSSNDVTLSLPSLGSLQRARGPISFKKTSASNNMIIDTAGSELIDGAASVSYSAQYASVTIAPYDQAYWII